MVRLIVNAAIYLGSAALGLFITSLILTDFKVTIEGLIISAILFAIFQTILGPFIFKMTHKYASALTGGVGLLSTFVALLLTTLLTSGLTISGLSTWIAGVVIVWLVTALATWLLPLFLLKEAVEKRKEG
ncbi:phage holin family protein [Demequina capsici]|uniref:Phage holin family protein n=1 Tax=Demequina capsici TaxID=3075620 RepID=A0AA96F5K2_9MICO|nr:MULTISPECIES: phage holin family protein [unclassified Demequina]WNM23558.1 phage holin family protein [Demequina sp. OYTSA14]WNM26423.1 phage holin family protein [Demequina sp. PMTSA13]